MVGLLPQGVWGSLLALEEGTARGPGANMHGSGRITELLNGASPEVMGCSDLSYAWVRGCGSSGFPEGPYRCEQGP